MVFREIFLGSLGQTDDSIFFFSYMVEKVLTNFMLMRFSFSFFFPLMQYTGMMLLEEMASIFLTPYLLIFVVPKVVYFFNRFIIIFFCTINASF